MTARGTLIWDFDGTLAARNFAWSDAFLEALSLLHPEHQITKTDIQKELSGVFPWHVPEHSHFDEVPRDIWWQPMERFLAEAFVRLGYADRKDDLTKLVRQAAVNPVGYQLYPDAILALTDCQNRGWHQVILSNHMPDLPAFVTALGLDSFIARSFASATLGFSKPSPMIFKKVLASLPQFPGLEGEAPVWMIGDSYEADVVGAEGVGIPAILVRSPIPRHDREVQDLREVVDFL